MNLSSNSSNNEPTSYKTHHHSNSDDAITHEYIATQMMLQQHQPQSTGHHLKKMDFQQSKDSNILLQVYGDPSGNNSAQMLQNANVQPPLLTPLSAKYFDMRQHAIDEHQQQQHQQLQMIAQNDESDKSDCDAFCEPLTKPVKSRSLPHKKRIAKRIVSDNHQPYTNQQQEEHCGIAIVLPNDETNNIRYTNPSFACSLCGDIMDHQLDFYIHLKKHYEPEMQPAVPVQAEQQQKPSRIVLTTELVGENLIINQNNEANLIESLADSAENLKSNEMHQQVIDEFDEFSEPEDMMEDFRKEVEKVVETIGENDVGEAQWVMNYQDEDMDEPQDDQNNVELQIYQEISQPTNYTTVPRAPNEVVGMHQPTPAELKSFDHVENFDECDDDDYHDDDESNEDEEESEDEKTLEQLRKETIEEVSRIQLKSVTIC